MSDAIPLRPGQQAGAGRCPLIKPLSRGGMGEVWLAQEERRHEPVALKFLSPEVRSNAGANASAGAKTDD